MAAAAVSVPGPTPRLSIGLPVFNGERFLPEALRCLRAQSGIELELIVCDNASTDATPEIVREAAAADPRIRSERSATNAGPAANFDRALRLARGELFMWAACDDLWEPEFASTLAARLHGEPGAALAFCAFDAVDAAGRPIRNYPDIADLPADDPAGRLARYIAQPEHLGKANLIYGVTRRRTLLEAGGFRLWSERDWGVDMLVVFRLLGFGGLTLEPRTLFHKRLVAAGTEGAGARIAAPTVRRGRLRARLRGWREEMAGWKAYFDGYDRLIAEAPGLDEARRAGLRRAVRARRREIRRIYLTGMGRVAAGRIARSARRP